MLLYAAFEQITDGHHKRVLRFPLVAVLLTLYVAEAVANACTEPWSNGMVEGFNHKVKWIKRSSYGQAGFRLLQRRVPAVHDRREASGEESERWPHRR